MRRDIKNIRYSKTPGKLEFDYGKQTIVIKEPANGTILVGVDEDAARHWIWVHYSFLLACLTT